MTPDDKPRLPLAQLLVLCFCRLAEPISLTSVFPYLPEMIESFGVPEDDVAWWAGATGAAFSVAQATTGIPWGTASDFLGRRPTLLAGLSLTMVFTVLFGFSQNLTWAICVRALAGASSGTIGITRTAVAEMVPWKELQPRAFSFMPMVWSVGSIVGPVFGGALAVPAKKYPDVFDVPFFRAFPFALPNIIGGIMFFVGVVLGVLFFKETLQSRKHRRDYGLILGQLLLQPFRRRSDAQNPAPDGEQAILAAKAEASASHAPIRIVDVFSVQSSLALLAYTLVAFHSIAYDQLLPVFLHRQPDDPAERSLPFHFAGGFGLSSGQIGILQAYYAILGLLMQFFVFPPLARRYGVLRCLRITTLIGPLPYILTPFAVLFPTSGSQRVAIFGVMAIKCVLNAFWFPCVIILLTNSAPSPQLLGTLNGVATSISAVGRACGPASAGAIFSASAKRGSVVVPWFYLAVFAGLTYYSTCFIAEPDDSDAKTDADVRERESAAEQEPLLSAESPTSPRLGYDATEQNSR